MKIFKCNKWNYWGVILVCDVILTLIRIPKQKSGGDVVRGEWIRRKQKDLRWHETDKERETLLSS